jgi:NAD(P)-dependent dehydrogenase (short-subunit alcohol dehydrogenase family)
MSKFLSSIYGLLAHSAPTLPIQRVPVDGDECISMSGKVGVITGGSRGIGAATCERFAKAGSIVIGTSRHPERVKCAPSGCELMCLDVRSDESVNKFVQCVADRYGRIDILVNNAGIGQYGRLIKAKVADWINLFETNLFGVHRMTVAAYPYMKAPDSRIVTLGSLEGETGYPYQALYAMSKRALHFWNDMLDFEQRNEGGPRCILLEPAWVNTGFGVTSDIVDTEPDSTDPYARLAKSLFPRFLKKFGIEPQEVAQAIYTIAAMPKPHMRYFVGLQGSIFMGHRLEDLIAMVYTQSPEATLAFMEAFTKIMYAMHNP